MYKDSPASNLRTFHL